MKVRVLPLQPHCFAFGGFEIQMLSALEAVRACGVDAQPMDIWSRNADFDIFQLQSLENVKENSFSVRLDYRVNPQWSSYIRVFRDNGTQLRPEGITERGDRWITLRAADQHDR